jgi:hypothetical protein
MLRLSTRAPAPKEDQTAHFMMFDSPAEIADFVEQKCSANRHMMPGKWYGKEGAAECCQKAKTGDLTMAAASDALLDKFERYVPETLKDIVCNDVVGAVANVPAYLAGHPLNMCRRSRAESDAGPLAIIVDLTISGGLLSQQIEKRGASILALTRILSAKRPIELWVGAGLNKGLGGAYVFSKVNTSPLDLATSAFALCAQSFVRRLCYASICAGMGSSGSWPFCNYGFASKNMEKIIAPAFTHTTETLCIPGAHVNDPTIRNPEAWLADQIAKHMPQELGA